MRVRTGTAKSGDLDIAATGEINSEKQAAVARSGHIALDVAVPDRATITLAVQVNGKLRGQVEVPADVDEAGAAELARELLRRKRRRSRGQSSRIQVMHDDGVIRGRSMR